MKISIIGIGRLGGALAIALSRKGFQVENLFVRRTESAAEVAGFITPAPRVLKTGELSAITSDVVFIAVRDSEIEKAAGDLAPSFINLRKKPFVFHTSGSLSSKSLGKLKEIGCKVASVHPLVSISDALLSANRFENVFFCLEGEPEAVETAREIVESLGGKAFSIETEFKTLYHAAAVTACGHLVAVVDTALEMLAECGLSESEGREILLPLIKSTVENLETQTTARALTGTFARADLETLRRQIETINENASPEALEIYLQLGRRSLHLAEREGANREKLAEMQKIISLAEKKIKC